MARALEKKLRAVWVRCSVNSLLVQVAIVLAVAGGAAALAVLAERLLAVRVVSAWAAGGAGAAAVLAIAALWLLRRPARMQVALLVDERLSWKERLSTAMSLAGSDDPFARAATREAHEAAERLNVRGRFPIRPSRHWLGTTATWLIAAGVFAFMPTLDVLGYLARQEQAKAEAAELEEVRVEVKQATATVRSAVQQLNNKVLEGELAKLEKLARGSRPAEVRRQAIRKLTDLADKARELRKSSRIQSAGRMQSMLKALKNTAGALSPELSRALAGSEFAKAAGLLREKLQQLNDSDLSEKQKQALARQLGDLARQLEQLGDAQKQGQEMLEQEGLDAELAAKLAKMDPQDLREALKKQGLTDKQIDELMEKLSACRQACSGCGRLGEALARCCQGGMLNPNGLVGLIECLDAMESLDGELADLEDVLLAVEGELARLGEGQCEGAAQVGLWSAASCNRIGPGPGGGRARAWGDRPTAEPEPVGHQKTGVKNKPSRGQSIIASWLFKGPQAKGVSRRKLTDAVAAGKDVAAEAIGDNRIPRRYEGPVKKYFGALEHSAAGDANRP